MDSKLTGGCLILVGITFLGTLLFNLQYERISFVVFSGYYKTEDFRGLLWKGSVNQSKVSTALTLSKRNNLLGLPHGKAFGHSAGTKHETTWPRPGDEGYRCENDKRKFITIEHTRKHRLGNSLFELAGLLGVAEANNMKIVLPITMRTHLDGAFGLSKRFCSAPTQMTNNLCKQIPVTQAQLKKNNQIIPDSAKGKDVCLVGYFIGKTYVDNVENRIRQICKFKPQVIKPAKDFMKSVSKPGYVNVGIHLRGGAFAANPQLWAKKGVVLPRDDYYNNTFKYFDNLFPRVQYIVCSYYRDPKWINANLKHPNIIINYRKYPPAVDMAILSLCDHLVTSAGTFGWWAAWFNPGVNLYPNNDFKKGDPMRPNGAIGIPSKAHQTHKKT